MATNITMTSNLLVKWQCAGMGKKSRKFQSLPDRDDEEEGECCYLGNEPIRSLSLDMLVEEVSGESLVGSNEDLKTPSVPSNCTHYCYGYQY